MTTPSLLFWRSQSRRTGEQPYYERGELATNDQLVARAARISEEFG